MSLLSNSNSLSGHLTHSDSGKHRGRTSRSPGLRWRPRSAETAACAMKRRPMDEVSKREEWMRMRERMRETRGGREGGGRPL